MSTEQAATSLTGKHVNVAMMTSGGKDSISIQVAVVVVMLVANRLAPTVVLGCVVGILV